MSVGNTGLPRATCRPLSTSARTPTTGWSAPAPDTMPTFDFRHAACGCPTAGRGLRLLDAGCGTGASTAALLSVAPQAEIIAVDASRGMLDEAQAKSWPSSVRFVHSPVEALAENGVVGPFDGILAAYLIRNLSDPDTQLRALRGLLAPGATLAVHDYSVRDSRAATWVWHAVCWGIIIPVRLAANRRRDAVPASVAQRADIRRRSGNSDIGCATRASPRCTAKPCRAGKPTSRTPSSGMRRDDRPAPPDASRHRTGLPSAEALSSRPRAVVVGAGIAGLAAATGLAERGISVDVIEREEYLGGRVGAWTEHYRGVEVAMNRGFHAFFRQYYNLRALLRRVDPTLSMLTPVDDYPLIDGAGRRDTFRGLPRTPAVERAGIRVAQPHFSAHATWPGSTHAPPRRWPRCRCPTSITASTTSTPRPS